MEEGKKQILIKRSKSYAWRLGGMIVVAILSFVSQQAELLELPNFVVVLLGLFAGEVTKYFKVDLARLKEVIKE